MRPCRGGGGPDEGRVLPRIGVIGLAVALFALLVVAVGYGLLHGLRL